ncbi:hypothetical protein ACIRJO_37610 [Streptomyces sp. NPDC102394]|uniref:hypothetical protein n=1 Tax=Streptomyces sp. NPDC102394 TaxID=3366167 RepID=UPI00381E5914
MTHGSIFNAIAKVRSTTTSSVVRTLADQANATVLDHITVMEQTGLVNFDQALLLQTSPPTLPATELTPPPPSVASRRRSRPAGRQHHPASAVAR